jgi:hypothetical protein
MKPLFRPGVGRQEGRQARDVAVDQHGDAALGDGAHLGDGQAIASAGQRHRLGVEVAAADHGAVVGKDQRVVGHGIGLAQQHQRGVAQLVQAGAHHLRLAAQAVRVLHAVVAVGVAGGWRCPASRRGSTRPRRSGPAGRARVDARVEGAVAAARGVHRQRADHQRRFQHRLEAEQRVQRQRGAGLRAVDQRQAFLGRQLQRRDALGAQRVGRRAALAVHHELALAHQRQRHVRQRRQVALAPTEPWLGTQGTRPALCTASSVSITTGGARPNSRAPGWRPSGQHQPHHGAPAARPRPRCGCGSG